VTEVSFPEFWETLARTAGMPSELRPASRPDGGKGAGGKEIRKRLVITLDGPAGSGKSTTAREVAARLGYSHLDSGALYRALTFALLEEGIPEAEWGDLTEEELDRFQISLRPEGTELLVLWGDRVLGQELRSSEVTARVSPLSAHKAVRAWLLGAQRRAAESGGVVADGRDMGTVVFPDADLKVFLTADLPERARRRFLERQGRLPDMDETASEAAEIAGRDTRDSTRAHAPLRKPEGALEVDTSELGFEEQVEIILNHVKSLTDQ
jgi:cytidylate kinase